MKILIVGGSRGIGLNLAKLALEKGYSVTVMSRNAGKLKLQHPNLTKIEGDATMLEDVEKCVDGVDVVVSTIGTRKNKKNLTLFSTSTRNILAAINGSNRLFIAVTGIGLKDTSGKIGFFYEKIKLPLFLSNIYRDKNTQEEMIKYCNTDWIIVRPAFLFDGPLTGNYKVVTDMNNLKCKRISRMDVAHFILNQIEKPVYLKKAVVLTY